MEHDDEIEKISKELEDMLRMTSDGKEDTTGETGLKAKDSEEIKIKDPQDMAGIEPDVPSISKAHLDDPVDGMEELYDKKLLQSEDVTDGDIRIEEEPEADRTRKKVRRGLLSGKREVSHKKESGTASLVRPADGLIAAFFVPVVIMIIIFAQRGIFPFGEESFLRTDMYHQYAPFFF